MSYRIGMDIGGTKCAVVLGSENTVILDKVVFPTEVERGFAYTLDQLLGGVDALLTRNGLDQKEMLSVGISCGGPLDSEKGIIQSPPNLPGWDNVPIVELIRVKYKVPVYLQNDADACALAEWTYGAGRGCRNMIFLTFGTGLGAGLILNGSLYTGTNGLAGEVGHLRLASDGPVGYGKKGSFEGFCSGGGIAQLAKAEIRRRWSAGEAVGFCPGPEQLQHITAQTVGRAAEAGDPVALDILRISGTHLGKGLSILIDILNPEMIVIGSIFARCRPFLQPAAEEVLQKEALAWSREVCRIVPAELGEEIGDYACLTVALGKGRI